MSAILLLDDINPIIPQRRYCRPRQINTIASIVIVLSLVSSICVDLYAVLKEDTDEICDEGLVKWLYWNMGCHFFTLSIISNIRSDLYDSGCIRFLINSVMLLLYVILPISGVNMLIENWNTCRLEMPIAYWVVIYQIIVNLCIMVSSGCLLKYVNRGVITIPSVSGNSLRYFGNEEVDEALSELDIYYYRSESQEELVPSAPLEYLSEPITQYSQPDSSEVYIPITEDNRQPINIESEDAHCCICISEYEENDQLRYLNCRHHFHKHCADEWLHRSPTCPVCTRSILDE
jgi:hypothetical protein